MQTLHTASGHRTLRLYAIRSVLMAFFVIAQSACYGLYGGAHLIGEAVRGSKKETDVALAPGITAARLQGYKNLGVSIVGREANSRSSVWSAGTGATNAGVYSDMVMKEFMKLGYQARSLSDDISEATSPSELQVLAKRGIELLIVGNLNMSMTTSVTSAYTGGDFTKSGVTSYTIKGLDAKTGDILFVLSTEYGKARGAGDVAMDLATLFRSMVSGAVDARAVAASNGRI